ncbi:MAG TPA: tetratricopeptide repeat protein [Longimicrobiales bacterium]
MNELKRSHAISLVLLAAIAVYVNSLWNGFAYDDVFIIQQNERVHQLSDLSRIWLTPYWPAFGSQLGLYRPFAIFAFAVEWAISGGAPWFFHLVNVLLHAGVSVLVFLLIERLFSRPAAIAGAVIFAIHPVHTEAVANVVGQNELWAAIGVLGACLLYVQRPEGATVSLKRGIGILLLFVVALLAKESAVVLPALLVLLDVVQGRLRSRQSVCSYLRGVAMLMLSLVVLFAGYLALRHSVLGTLAGTDAAPGLPHLREQYRILNALRAWPEFVRLLFFPLDLSVDYAPGTILPVESFTPMVALGALLVLTVIALAVATPFAPRAGLVAGWFLITILPVSNFFFPIGVLIAERTLYLPSLAVCFLAGFAWEAARKSVEQETRRLAVGAAVVVVAFFGIRTVIRNPDWDSLNSVWRSLSRDHPESYRAQWLNAVGMWRQGRPDLAERYFEIAYKLWPRDSQMITEWGNFYIGQGRFGKAIPLLEQSRDMTPFVPRTHEYLAHAYLYEGRAQEALETAIHASGMEGSHPSIYLPTMATAYERLGQHAQAAATWSRVVQLKSGNLWLNWAMLARAQARARDLESARKSAAIALARAGADPRSLEAARKLGPAIEGCYQTTGQDCDPLAGWQVQVSTVPRAVR